MMSWQKWDEEHKGQGPEPGPQLPHLHPENLSKSGAPHQQVSGPQPEAGGERAHALEALERTGKSLARQADPSYHSFEDRDRATSYQKHLPYLRQAYAKVRGGADPKQTLGEVRDYLNRHLPSEQNIVRLALHKMGVSQKPSPGAF